MCRQFRALDTQLYKHIRFKINILIVSLLIATAQAADLSLNGSWQCIPYELEFDQFIAVGSEAYVFHENQTYEEVEYASYFYKESKETLETVVSRTGTWNVENYLLLMSPKEARVVSSSNDKVSIKQLQEFEDQEIKSDPKRLFQISLDEDYFTYRVLNEDSSSEVKEKMYECKRV